MQEENQSRIDSREFSILKQDITDMKTLMSRMVETMSRITIIEERQHTMALSTGKAIERMETLTERQHAYELASVEGMTTLGRVNLMESNFRELHVENERNKARFQTFSWTLRALWAIVGGGGAVWLIRVLQHAPT